MILLYINHYRRGVPTEEPIIVQLSVVPIKRDKYFKIDDIIKSGFLPMIARDIIEDSSREECLNRLLSCLDEFGIDYNREKQSIVFLYGFRRRYFGDRLQRLKDYVKNLSNEEFINELFVVTDIERLVSYRYGIYVYYMSGKLIPFDDFVRILDEGKVYYIGNLVEYE